MGEGTIYGEWKWISWGTDEEVPHSVTCIVDELYEEEKIINIGASIIVDRENLKKIIYHLVIFGI